MHGNTGQNLWGSNLLLHTVEKHIESLKEMYAAHKNWQQMTYGPVCFICIAISQEDLWLDETYNFDQPICEFGNEQRSPLVFEI